MVDDESIDHIHMRLFIPGAYWSRLTARSPFSLEVHALLSAAESPRDVYRLTAGWLPARRLVRGAAGGVFITREMADRFGHPALPRTAIGNGVVLRAVTPAPASDRPRVGFAVGSRGAWHGLDRLSALAELVPQATWVVVAPEHLAAWVATELGASSTVEIAVSRSREEYDDILSGLDAALGTLALDRRRLVEAAPLKVRDCIAVGIPVILPYTDTNLDTSEDAALLRIDARDLPAAAVATRAWLRTVIGRRVSDATRSRVDLNEVERCRLRFLQDLTASY
jgi:hypothetical protein